MQTNRARLANLAGTTCLAMGSAAFAQDAPLNVLGTIAMVSDVAQNVGGDCVVMTTLIGDGSDPHLYQATPSDVEKLRSADLVLYSGFALEGQLGDVLGVIGKDRPTLAVGPASVPPANLLAVEDVYGIDPHIWMDVSLWSMSAPTIAAKIAELRPDCAEAVAANAAAYQAQLAALDAWAKASIATIPEAQRILVTAHDAFGYYSLAYNIKVSAIQGLSTETEASIADIEAVAEAVAASGVPTVFIETTINPRTIEAMIAAVANKGGLVSIGGELFSDAMGAEGTAEGTYIGMMHSNTVTITKALGGTPTPLPAALDDWAATWKIAE